MNVGIRPSANSKKMKRVVRLETSVCFRITRLMNNQTKSRKKGNYSPKRRESDDKNAVAIVKSVSQLGCVSQDADALVSQCRKQYRGNPMQKVLESIRRIRFTMSTLRQAARLGILLKTYTSSEKKDKAAFYYPAEEWVLPTASTNKREEREFAVDSGASMHMVSKKDLHSAELETMRTSRSPFVVPGSEFFLNFIFTYFFIIFITGIDIG